jgi:hypothetical protein
LPITTPPIAGFGAAGSHLVTVRGHAGETSSVGAINTLSWPDRLGLRVDLAGTGLGDEEIAAFAASLAPVAPDDPRVP